MKKFLFFFTITVFLIYSSVSAFAAPVSKVEPNHLYADTRCITEYIPQNGQNYHVFQYAIYSPDKVPTFERLLSGYSMIFSSAIHSVPSDPSSDIIPVYCIRITVDSDVYDYLWITPHELEYDAYPIVAGLPGNFAITEDDDGEHLAFGNYGFGDNKPKKFSESEVFRDYVLPDNLKNYYILHGQRFDFSGMGYYVDRSDYQYDSYQDFFNGCPSKEEMEDDFFDKNEIIDNKLPMLKYNISAKNVLSFPNVIDKKLSIDWSFADIEPYCDDPMKYALEIIISAHFYPNSEGLKNCWDSSKKTINGDCKRVLSSSCSLLENPYSFIYLKEGSALYESTNHVFATDELQDGYYLYIRSYSRDGLQSSNYKVYKCTTGGAVGQEDITYDVDGNEYDLDESDKDNEQEYSNEYDEDSSSSADKDPTGDSFDGNGGYSFDTLFGNLKSMVNMLQGIPQLWSTVMSWLPPWFTDMIVTMLGFLIVVGVLKYIF